MSLPVFITIEDAAFESAYGLLSNPIVVFSIVLGVLGVFVLIHRILAWRERRRREFLRGQFEGRKEKPKNTEELQRLREKEARIKEMESVFKSRRITRLDERERRLLERQVLERQGKTRPALSEPLKPEPAPQAKALAPALPAAPKQGYVAGGGDYPAGQAEGVGSQPPAAGGASELARERDKLKKMIDMASKKYESGEINREAFTRIETDYYKKLIDLEIRMREGG